MSPLLIVVILLVVALVIFAFRGKGTAQMEHIHVERLHDWEQGLSEADEEALVAGLEKWRDGGHDLVPYHEGAKIDVYEPPMVVSLYALADAFVKERDAGKIMDRFAAREIPGASMHLSREWNNPPGFAALAAEVLSEPGVAGVERAGTDEVRGVIDLGIRAGGPTNTLAIDLARLHAAVEKLREEDDKAPQRDLVRRALGAAVERDDDGVLWIRTPTEAERDVARRGVSRTSGT